MIKSIVIKSLVLFFIVNSSLSQAESTPVAEAVEAEAGSDSLQKDLSYFFGFSFGNMLKEGGNVDVDMPTMNQGMADSLAGKAPDMTEAQQTAVITAIQSQQEAAQRERAAEQSALASRIALESTDFMAANATKDGVMTTDSGLQYETLVAGTGMAPNLDSTVKVQYEGKLTNGQVFDSSIARGTPAEFGLSQVIPGWTEGLQLMKAGGKTRFTIPSDLAYGPGGTRGIPPNSVLIFEVELLEIN
jgi:FKBP-type peptidyl-prolyl cis-trans isomerase